MRSSRLGIIVLITFSFLFGANCSYYNRIIARKNLVDGSAAYNGKKFKEAEEFFRKTISIDPDAKTQEGKIARIFLARTIHSQYISNRSPSFGESDFIDVQSLAKKLSTKSDSLSEYLNGRLKPETQELVGKYMATSQSNEAYNNIRKELITALNREFNEIIKGESIYDANRFGQVTLSEFTKSFMEKQKTGERLNRLLIEDAYPQEIAKKPKAEDAIDEYKKVLANDINEQSAFKAVANLLDNLDRKDEALKWVTDRSENQDVKPSYRAEAYISLAAKQYSCANDISDIDPVKKTEKKDGKDVYVFTKPQNPEDFTRLKECTAKGMDYIDKALALEKQDNVETDSVWSYKANLLIQKMRIAEMDGNTTEKDSLKAEADKAKEKFTTLAAEKKRKEDEEAAKKKAEEEAANTKK